MVTMIIAQWRQNYRWLVPVALFLVALGIRWYQLPQHLFFGFEQGRDAMVSTAIARGQDFVLVGPKTDIGGVFHGAWYYYLMAFPYGLGHGDPLVASFFLVVLTSLVPVVMWYLGLDIFRSQRWALAGAGLSLVSYEAMYYSRWLSNVTPAFLGVPVIMWWLWKFRQTKRDRWFIAAAVLAGLVAQFEIILTAWFVWLLILMWIFRWLPRPSLKNFVLALMGAAFWFAPMVAFNLRNDWISIKSAQMYMSESSGSGHAPSTTLINGLVGYSRQLLRLTHRNLIGVDDWRWWVTLVVGFSGLVMAIKQKVQREAMAFSLFWLLMTMPVILFSRSLDLPQLYIGSGLSLIWLWVIAIKAWWQPMWGKVVALVAVVLVMSSWFPLLSDLHGNRDVFFRTIQDDLNYADQMALLQYVHEDADGAPYRLQAFSIPYFQDQGWRYLHTYLYPDHTEHDAKIIYVVIEKPVEAFWIKKWTEDLGPTKLIDSRMFGLIKVEKRTIL